jgi:hypothetical protein
MTKHERVSLGRDKAIAIYNTQWWIDKTYRQIAMRQLFTAELICPFNVFHEAVEKSLERPVWTHEFGLNYDGICDEFLGDSEPPTMEEIINLIPEAKRMIVTLPQEEEKEDYEN